MADQPQKTPEQLMEDLVAKLTPTLSDTILEKVTASVEEQVQGLKAKNDELLGKLAEQKDHSDALAAQLSKLKPEGVMMDGAIRITREDARNVAKYRRAKAQAEERGVALQIVQE